MTASMRPRHIAAENGPRRGLSLDFEENASMRPRHIAAENWIPGDRLAVIHPGFNEAAAYSRGKRPLAGAGGSISSELQ